MSEYTNYFALKKDSYDEITDKLKRLDALAVIDDFPSKRLPDPAWVAIEVAREPGSLFEIERLAAEFEKVVEIFIDEDYKTWNITCCLKGDKRSYDFTDNSTALTEVDKNYLVELFDVPLDTIEPHMAKGGVESFCGAVRMPCNILSDQSLLPVELPKKYGGVVLASQISDF